MFTMATGLRGQAQRQGWMPTKTTRLAALVGTLVLMSVAVNAFVHFADSTVRRHLSAPEDCSAIAERTGRLACFDGLTRRPAPHPFRGANAPALGSSF